MATPRGRLPAAVITVAAVAALLAAAAGPAAADPYGPDVASYQHPHGAPIHWRSVAGEPDQHFAIIKATQGTNYVNPYMASDAAQARASGLLVGFYHFAVPGYAPRRQADFFARTIGPVRPGELPPILDLEISGTCGRRPCRPGQVVTWTRLFLARLQSDTHRRPMIYTDPGFWNSAVRSRAFGSYPLWLADYTYNPALPPTAFPVGWSHYALWQYTDNASIPGIVGATDRSTGTGPFGLDRLAHADPNRYFLDAIALDTRGALLPDAQEAALDAALDAKTTTRTIVATALTASGPYLRRVVRAAYQQVFARPKYTAAQILAAAAALKAGLTPAGLLARLTGSGAFYQAAGGTAADFITAAYSRLAAEPVPPGMLARDERRLRAGVPRAEIATTVLASPAGLADQIGAAYAQVLRRPPTPAELATAKHVLRADRDDVTPLRVGLYASLEYLEKVALAGR